MRGWKALLALGLIVLPAFAAKRVVTHEDLWMLKRVGAPALSPDGRWAVVSVVEPDYDATKQVSDLWIAATDGNSAPRRLTSTKAPESGVNWAPDSHRIAFTTKREDDDFAQVYVLDITGGEAQRVTAHAGAVSNPQWSPDGARLLFESMFDPVADRKARKYSARTYDAFPMRHWNAWLDEKRPHLYVQDAVAGRARARPARRHQARRARRLLRPVRADRRRPVARARVDAGWPRGRLQRGGEWRYVDGPAGRVSSLRRRRHRRRAASPRSRRGLQPRPAALRSRRTALYFALEKDATLLAPYALPRLAALPWPALGTPHMLTALWDRAPGGVVQDGASLWIEAEDAGSDKIFRLATPFPTKPSAGASASFAPPSSKDAARQDLPQPVFAPAAGGYSGLRAAGGVLVALYGSAAQPPELAVLDANTGSHRMLTHFNDAKLAELDLPAVQSFWFTAANGKRIHSLIVPPPAYDPAKKYPLVVFPHGGPNSMSKDNFGLRWNYHLLTSPGYFLLMTNYTGSTGFGESPPPTSSATCCAVRRWRCSKRSPRRLSSIPPSTSRARRPSAPATAAI